MSHYVALHILLDLSWYGACTIGCLLQQVAIDHYAAVLLWLGQGALSNNFPLQEWGLAPQATLHFLLGPFKPLAVACVRQERLTTRFCASCWVPFGLQGGHYSLLHLGDAIC